MEKKQKYNKNRQEIDTNSFIMRSRDKNNKLDDT